jgi:hypothetical protein
MSYMADKDHIAITSRDASTTRRKFLYRDARLPRRSLSLSVSLVTLIVVSRRRFRNGARKVSAGPAGYSVRHLVFGERAPPAVCAPVHRYRELALALGYPVDGRGDLGDRLVTAQCVVAE